MDIPHADLTDPEAEHTDTELENLMSAALVDSKESGERAASFVSQKIAPTAQMVRFKDFCKAERIPNE